nr:hypothetical protein [Tanacetum cinerariifolium]
MAFVFAESTSNTNELNDAYSCFTATGHSSQAQGVEMLGMQGIEEETMLKGLQDRRMKKHPKHIPAKINFVKAVFTRSGRIPVSAAKPKAVASTSAAKLVNTAGPKQSVNFSNSRNTFHKSNSPIRRSFYDKTAHSKRNSTERFNTAGSKAVSAVKRNRVTAVKALEGNKAYLADYQEINDGGFVAFG